MKKGQISTLDLVIASSIFIGILLLAMTSWNDILLKSYRFENKREIYQKALDVAESLVTFEGSPSDWHLLALADIVPNNVSSFGLAKEPNVLDRDKIEKLNQVDYDTARDILGLGREEFNLTIYNSTNDVVYSMGNSIQETTALVQRYALLDGYNAKIELRLFYNTSTGLIT